MTPRRTLTQTRAILLEIGAAILHESGIHASLQALSLVDVCREAGLRTAGSGYKIWPTQQAFQTDLLRYLTTVQSHDFAALDRLESVLASSPDQLTVTDTVIRSFATIRTQALTSASHDYDVYLALLLASRHDAAIAHDLQEGDRQYILDAAALYDELNIRFGRAWRPPFSGETLAVTLSALFEGFTMRSRTTPQRVEAELLLAAGEDPTPRPWTLVGIATAVLLDAFTIRTPENREHRPPESTRVRDVAADTNSPDVSVSGHEDFAVGTKRRSIDDTRALLLATGARMIADAKVAVTLGAVDLLEVCQRAGLQSAGSAYKIWATQDEFRIDLLRQVLATTIVDDETITQVSALLASDDRPTLMELTRIESYRNFQLHDWGTTSVHAALWLTSAQDPTIAIALAEHDNAALDGYAALYAMTAKAYEREWIPPFSPEHLAVVLSALVQGMALRKAVTPDLIADDLWLPTGPKNELQPWHVFSYAAHALIERFTRPRSTALDHRD